MEKLTLLFTLALVAASTQLSLSKDDTSGGVSSYLKYIVSVDGKSFYTDRTITRNRDDSSYYCHQYGMKLASITSAAQFNALDASFSENFTGSYWTNGRDALELRQFTWHGSREALSMDYLRYRPIDTFQTCISFHSLPGESELRSYTCKMHLGALCEATDDGFN